MLLFCEEWGADGRWLPVTDEHGRTLDDLVYSNTTDLANYPACAYFYPVRSLIHIAGWNG